MSIAFWASVALLLAGAMLFVLPPLLRPAATRPSVASPMDAYREQRAQLDAELAQGALSPGQHRIALEELQSRVVEEVGDPREPAPARGTPPSTLLVVAVALLLPAGALALYGVLGQPAALRGEAAVAAGSGEASPHAATREQMEAMVEGLAEKLKRNPKDPAGWHMLARSYVAFNRLPEAAEAYDEANRQQPGDPQLLADFADVLAMANGRSLEGRPEQLVLQALKADPRHQKALALAGTAAFNRGEFPKAADWWQQLLATLPPGSEQAKSVQANIDQALAGGVHVAQRAAPTPAPAPADNAAVAMGGPSVEGQVVVADAVKGKLPPGAVLFVYARPADGSRMPLAILRLAAGSFPVKFRLDDSLAMAPQARISQHAQVMLVARVSKTGDATPVPGDLVGTLKAVKVGAREIRLVIDEVVP